MDPSPPPNPRTSALLTDLYELTMAQGYWKSGLLKHEAVFHLFFRSAPFQGGYTIAAGLGDAIAWLRDLRFTTADLEYLSTLAGNDGRPLFLPAFLDHLADFQFTCDVDAIPEGTVVFPQEPLVRVSGPLLAAQIVETALLTFINFESLIATKAARICAAADGEPVIEFGLRRAQGVDGGLAAARAAYIGGCAATSNVLAGRLLGIPLRGTHAHSWVSSFSDERTAFRAYADAARNNCVLLVDTYDTLQGVAHAIEVARELRAQGHRLAGIRLDSGDLAYLSAEARRRLDEAGFADVPILASNELDEHVITSLKQQGAPISAWGVGTKLVTAFDDPALGGIYKLSAVRAPHGPWQYRIKLSEQAVKTSNPGILQVRRFSRDDLFEADMIFNELEPPTGETCEIVDPQDPLRRKSVPADAPAEDLLVPVFRRGELVYREPELAAIRARTAAQLARLHPAIRRLLNPHTYPAGLERGLLDLKTRLIEETRRRTARG